jgi:hypothetical protein
MGNKQVINIKPNKENNIINDKYYNKKMVLKIWYLLNV